MADRDHEETRKRITAALVAGRRMIHFANCQGHIDDQFFIQAITAPVIRVRMLGGTSAQSDLALVNECEFSLSANVGLTFREDVEPRCRRIDLAFYDEDENGRTFPKPFLHKWVKENRWLVLSAIAGCYRYWIRKGMPSGKTPFTSFPRWAEVVGGVMAACELGDPCQPHEEQMILGGDQRTLAMRALYELSFAEHPNRKISKQVIYRLIQESQETDERLIWFGDFEKEKRTAEMRVGRALAAFQNRVLAGVRLVIDTSLANSQKHTFCFRKVD